MFAGTSLMMGHTEDFDKTGLIRFLPVYNTQFILNYDDNFLPGASTLSKFF